MDDRTWSRTPSKRRCAALSFAQKRIVDFRRTSRNSVSVQTRGSTTTRGFLRRIRHCDHAFRKSASAVFRRIFHHRFVELGMALLKLRDPCRSTSDWRSSASYAYRTTRSCGTCVGIPAAQSDYQRDHQRQLDLIRFGRERRIGQALGLRFRGRSQAPTNQARLSRLPQFDQCRSPGRRPTRPIALGSLTPTFVFRNLRGDVGLFTTRRASSVRTDRRCRRGNATRRRYSAMRFVARMDAALRLWRAIAHEPSTSADRLTPQQRGQLISYFASTPVWPAASQSRKFYSANRAFRSVRAGRRMTCRSHGG